MYKARRWRLTTSASRLTPRHPARAAPPPGPSPPSNLPPRLLCIRLRMQPTEPTVPALARATRRPLLTRQRTAALRALRRHGLRPPRSRRRFARANTASRCSRVIPTRTLPLQLRVRLITSPIAIGATLRTEHRPRPISRNLLATLDTPVIPASNVLHPGTDF